MLHETFTAFLQPGVSTTAEATHLGFVPLERGGSLLSNLALLHANFWICSLDYLRSTCTCHAVIYW